MLGKINEMDKRAKIFLIAFLHIIMIYSVLFFCFAVYMKCSASAYEIALFEPKIKIFTENLLLSLCECIGGSLLMDYVFKRSE